MSIVLILILATVLRLINLNQSFWLDEAISALTAQKPFPYQWVGITKDVHPPLYYLLLHFLMQLGKSSEWFLRLPSVFFGILTILMVYKLVIDLFDKKTAILTSLLLATSQFHIYYSQELRMYSLFCLLATLSFWVFFKKEWVYLAVIDILGLYTHYMFSLLFLPQIIWLTYKYRDDKKTWLRWLISFGAAILISLPWWPNFIKQLMSNRNLIIALPGWKTLSAVPFWKLLPQLILKFTLGRIDFYNKYFYFVIFIVLVILYGFIFLSLKNKLNEKIKLILIWLFRPVIGALLISYYIPIADTWRFLFLLPQFLILLSLGLLNTKYSKIFIMFIFLINSAANVLYWTNPRYQREDWRDAVAFIDRNENPVIFAVENGFAPYQWYRQNNKLVCGPETIDKCLKFRQFFYVSYLQELFDPQKKIETKITLSGFNLKNINDFSGVGFVKTYENSY
jgi:uncharacterized membrane protein